MSINTIQASAENIIRKVIETLYLSNYYEDIVKTSRDRIEKNEAYHDLMLITKKWHIKDYDLWNEEFDGWQILKEMKHAPTVSLITWTIFFGEMRYRERTPEQDIFFEKHGYYRGEKKARLGR